MTVLDIATLGEHFQSIALSSKEFSDGAFQFVLNGHPMKAVDRSVHFICEPAQVWVTVVGQGERIEVALQDDYLANEVQARIKSREPWKFDS